MQAAISNDYALSRDAHIADDLPVDWETPPTLAKLETNYRDAQVHQYDQINKINGWLDNLRVEGKAKIKPAKGRSSVVPKLIRKQAEWRFAALSEPFLSTDDLFDVEPATWEDSAAAKQNSLLLNHQFRKDIDRIAFIDEYVRAAVEEGTVIVRVGWKFREEKYPVQLPVFNLLPDPQFQPTLEEVAQLREANPNVYERDVPYELKGALEASMEQGIAMRPILNGEYEEVIKTRIVENRPTLEICNIRNLYIDPTCQGDLDRANFVVWEFESSKSELLKDGRYKNIEQIGVESSDIIAEPDFDASIGNGSFSFNDDARRKFVVREYWGYWDIHGTGTVEPIVVSWVGKVIIQMAENPYPDKKIPFVAVPYLPVRKHIYGEPDGALLEDNQKIIGAVTRGMIDILGRSANGQTGTAKGFLDATNRAKYERGADYEFNPNTDPRIGVYPHTYPEIPNSALTMIATQNQEAESLTGVKAFAGGLSGDALGDVATAVRGVLDAASKREVGILRRLSRGIIEIAKKIVAMNAEFLSDVEVVRVTNDHFVDVRRDELAGKFDLKLTISTAEEDNAKAERLEFMLQTMGNNLPQEYTNFILEKIANLRKMPDLAKRIKDFVPQPDPIQQQIQQLEIQKLQAEIAHLQSQTLENRSEAMLDQAKAGTEQAKASQLQAQSNQAALDFVEQGDGVTQERDLEKQKAQAQGNMQLELLKDQLDQRKDQRKQQIKDRDTLLKLYIDGVKSRNSN